VKKKIKCYSQLNCWIGLLELPFSLVILSEQNVCVPNIGIGRFGRFVRIFSEPMEMVERGHYFQCSAK